jgi:hypothetical protein
MPHPPADRRNARPPTALVWGSVALAAMAVLIVLVDGSAASLRITVVLLAVTVVLLATSALIRNDRVLLRLDVDDQVAARSGALREEMQDEFAAAARAIRQSLLDDLLRRQGQFPPAAAQRTVPAQWTPGGQRPPGSAPREAGGDYSPAPGRAPNSERRSRRGDRGDGRHPDSYRDEGFGHS